MSYTAIGGFADLWLYSDSDPRTRPRDLRAHVIAEPCETCGAPAGSPCHRETDAGQVERRMPHAGRGGPSVGAHNRPSMRGRYKRRGAG